MHNSRSWLDSVLGHDYNVPPAAARYSVKQMAYGAIVATNIWYGLALASMFVHTGVTSCTSKRRYMGDTIQRRDYKKEMSNWRRQVRIFYALLYVPVS